ncbi:hypothetical protein ACFWUP_10680 [Nocardia sp. NPDC058658]|uniref:hypothetical protein n=1 Tax=Nocardia sp. NPDC058658 TaxID=3346580 RepID=UPI003657E29D
MKWAITPGGSATATALVMLSQSRLAGGDNGFLVYMGNSPGAPIIRLPEARMPDT